MSATKKDAPTLARDKPPPWQATPGMYIAGAAEIDPVDQLASEMEGKWGCGRLRLLVTTELREKFDRQRYLLNQAIWYGDLEAVRTQAKRMIIAWQALDHAAEAGCKMPLPANHLECTLEDGTVAAIVPTAADWNAATAQGRRVVVYSLDEMARMLSHYREVTKAKEAIPGLIVTRVDRSIEDPLNGLPTSRPGLDDPLPDFASPFGAG